MKPFAFLFLIAPALTFAQSPKVQQVAAKTSIVNLRKDVYALASDNMAGRLMGSHGDSLAARYVANTFRNANVKAPYVGNSYFQTISATRFDDKSTLSFNGQSHLELDGWQLFPNDVFKAENLPVLVDNFKTIEDWNKALPALSVEGKAVLLSDSLFYNLDRLDSLEKVLVSRGAKLVLWSGPGMPRQLARRKEVAFLPVYREPAAYVETGPIHEIGMTVELIQQLMDADHIKINKEGLASLPAGQSNLTLSTPLSVNRTRQEATVTAPNVIGIIKGTDPNAEPIILSAHHDHQGKDGNVVYYGAVDNASGTAAIMEIARLFHQAQLAGLRPKRTIIIGSWTGEERGLLGSYYYREHPLVPVEKTFAVLNMDMLGRIDTLHLKAAKTDSNYAYILVRDTTHRQLRKALYDADKSVGLTLDTYYENPKYAMRRVMGSDQFAFYEKGVPFVRIDCGFATEYHKPGDTPDKIDYPLLTKQTRLAFLTLWNMAQL